MKKNKILLLLCLVLVFALSANLVLGVMDNVLEPIFDALESFRITENYERYHLVVDFILYLIIFIGVARKVLKDRLGSGPAAGIGIVLALSLSFFEYKQGFSVIDFGLIGAIIITFLVGFFIYSLLSNAGATNTTAFAFAFILIFLILQGTAPSIFQTLEDRYPLLYGILMLIFVIALVKAIMGVFGIFKGSSLPSWGNGKKGESTSPKSPIDQKRGQKQAEQETDETEDAEKKALKEAKLAHNVADLSDEIEKLTEIEQKLANKTLMSLQEEERILDELRQMIIKLRQYQKVFNDIDKYLKKNPLSDDLKQKTETFFEQFGQVVEKFLSTFEHLKNNYKSYVDEIDKQNDINSRIDSRFKYVGQALRRRQALIQKLDEEITKLRGEIEQSNWDPNKKTMLQNETKTVENELNNLKQLFKLDNNDVKKEFYFKGIKKDDMKLGPNTLVQDDMNFRNAMDELENAIAKCDKILMRMHNYSEFVGLPRRLGVKAAVQKISNWFINQDIGFLEQMITIFFFKNLETRKDAMKNKINDIIKLAQLEKEHKVIEEKETVEDTRIKKLMDDIRNKLKHELEEGETPEA